MRKIVSLLTATSMLFAMTACSNDSSSTSESTNTVNQSDYDKLKADNSNLQEDYNKLKQELDELKNVNAETPTEKPTEAPTEATTEAPTEATTEKKDEKKVLWESDTVKITYVGTEASSRRTDVKLQLENLSDMNIMVQVRDVSVNGYMVTPVFSSNVVSGKKANDEISFYNLADEGVDALETIEFYFIVVEKETLDDIETSDTITLNYE